MKLYNDLSFLYTDMYQLTMMQAYFKDGRKESKAVFDYFFRKIPFNGGYLIFSGLADFLKILNNLKFRDNDISYLKKNNFDSDFRSYLKNFTFKGTIYSAAEGEIVFPLEPIIRVEASLPEAQLIETLLLNIINFQSLISTKASRIRLAAGEKHLSEFGLRRAQSLGGIHASRAAVIGGFDSTSNVYAAKEYGITAAGTMAHSYIQSYDDELTAFRNFVSAHPENAILLVDTYNTLKSGIPNAIKIAKELNEKNLKLNGIRLDSGDLAYLAVQARQMLDAEGLQDVKIIASNKLDEYVIKSLIDQQAPIDIFGVGTSLVTGEPDAALDGVYKLAMADGQPRLKLSETTAKITLPGLKQVLRYFDDDGKFYADAVILAEENEIDKMIHPYEPEKSINLNGKKSETLLKKIMENGIAVYDEKNPEEIKQYCLQRLKLLPGEYKRFENPHIYKVGLSKKLLQLREDLRKSFS